MEQREIKEEKNKRVGWLVSVGIQLFMLILFYFLVAWKAPFPPIPEYGIELGFTQSAGAVPATPPGSKTEEIPNEEIENSEESTSTEANQEQVEEIPNETTLVEESEVPVEAIEYSQETEIVEEIAKDVVTNPESEPQKETGESDEEEEKEEEPNIDERAIYGSQGTNTGNEEGASLALSGWIWDFKPKPDDESDETGKIVYKIVVDQEGYLVKIETITTTVSPSVERKYRQAVQKLTFSKTSEYKPAPLSTGTLTFIIKTR